MPGPPASAPAQVQCRLCGQGLRTVGSRHLQRAHGITLAQYAVIVDQLRSQHADGCLPDGTLYFGRVGELAYDADEDRVQCHLCGEWFKWVGGLHLKYRHPEWTIARYREAFGLSGSQSTMAATSRAGLRALTVERLRDGRLGSPFGGSHGLQSDEWRSFVQRRPDLVAELHPTRNADVDFSTLGVWSMERVWWRCGRCGREWQTTIRGRAAIDGGCPACGPQAAARSGRRGRRPPLEQRSLAVLRPDLALELHPDRNPGLDARQVSVWAKRKVWWRCPQCAYEWEAMIMNRQQGNGCPRCAGARRIATYEHNRSQARGTT